RSRGAQQECNCQLLCFPPQVLTDWINSTLKEEHIVVRSLEEDLYDGLVLHHLLENLASLKLDVDKIALTEKKQRQKLSVILEAVAKCLQLEESQLKWSVESIFTKDLLSTLHLLVAIAKHFKPSLAMPPNVQVETITIEVTGVSIFAAVDSRDLSQDKFLDAVKKVIYFFNRHQHLSFFIQFADGVILLLLIGQLEGYFLNLRHFFLTPASTTEMVAVGNLHLFGSASEAFQGHQRLCGGGLVCCLLQVCPANNIFKRITPPAEQNWFLICFLMLS
uniref:Parvin gamma n=1 Tax=Athene cunicularia TaxID=194338 RepID=A0A663M7T3_ATHCN